MALKLPTNNPYDGVAQDSYWKVVEMNINWLNKSMHVTLLGWLDEQSRIDGRQPISSRSYDWSGDDFPFNTDILMDEANALIGAIYGKIQGLTTIDDEGNEKAGEFATATDV